MTGYSIADFIAVLGGDTEPTAVPSETAVQATGGFSPKDFDVIPEVTLRKESRKDLATGIVENMPTELAEYIIRQVAEAVAAGTPSEALVTLTRRVRNGDEYIFGSIASAIAETLHRGISLEGTEVD